MIPIKIYYQKHKHLQAFQFNGTWIQLRQQLPADIFAELVKQIFNHETINPTIKLGDHNQLTELIFDSGDWPIKNEKASKFIRNIFHDPRGKKIKYNRTAENLFLNDYIILTQHAVKGTFNHRHYRKPYFFKKRLIFKRPHDFTAHWQDHPIKSERK